MIKDFKFKSLTMRIWMTFTLIILIIVLCISLIYMFIFTKIDERTKRQDLKTVHEQFLSNTPPDQPNIFNNISSLKDARHFVVDVDSNNKIVNYEKNMNHPMPPHGGNDNDEDVKKWLMTYIKDATINEKEYTQTYKDTKYIFIISSKTNSDNTKSYLISYVPVIRDNMLLYIVMLTGIVFIVIGFFTAKIVAGSIAKPLKELENYSLRIAEKNWREPMEVKSDDEIGSLIKSMNHMQRELKRAEDEEKMFLQSISHELKTPVMVIMSHADAIIDGVYIDSVEQTAEIIRDEAISLEKKIKQMLYLNTLDYVLDNNNENSEFSLHDLLMKIISRFEVINSKISWELDIDKVNMRGNCEKIQVAIENIVDNALRYAKDKISISLKKQEDKVKLEIYNDGPNIPDQHIDHIFDNLYKDKTGNFGLGLAISKKIINHYNGNIRAVNREKGVSFLIEYNIDNQ